MNNPKQPNNDDSNYTDCCSPKIEEKTVTVASEQSAIVSSGSTKLKIAEMDCAAEEAEIRRAISYIESIDSLRFNLGKRELTIYADTISTLQAMEAIRRAGFKPELIDDNMSEVEELPPRGRWSSWGKPILALGLALIAELLEFTYPDAKEIKNLGMVLAGLSITLAGLEIYTKGFTALRNGKLNINALMTVAVTGAFLIGQWPEAAMVMALYAIAEAIEAKAVDRARNAIKSLLSLTPEDAEVLQIDRSWARELVKNIPIDAKIRVRPGERIPMDGIITVGQSAIDQSPVTGESLPVDKSPADEVFAGTINQASELEIRVTALASNSTLSRIINSVEQAQGTRAPTQRFVDRFAAIYTPSVFFLALAVAILMPIFTQWTWIEAIYKALVLLVIACPCALVISTPVTVVSGLAAAARRGILIKGGVWTSPALLDDCQVPICSFSNSIGLS